MTRLEAALAELAAAIREEVAAPAQQADRLHSIEEAAELLAVGRTTVYQEIAAGRLASIKIGKRRVIPSGAIAAYLTRAMAA